MNQTSKTKEIIILAGPNGAGKTTFAGEYLPNEARNFHFINADLIAQGLSPFKPEQARIAAGKLMLQRIDALANARTSFCFETTLSGAAYAKRIPAWRAAGYTVVLYYLKLTSPAMAVARVAKRVQRGGHHIPEADIRRRFQRSQSLLESTYKPLVNNWVVFDNSENTYKLLEKSDT